MQVFIRSKGIPITNALDTHIKNRINFILFRFTDDIRKIEIFVADENGPKGGVDQSCIVRIKTDHRSELVVKDVEADLFVAVTRALARAKKSLTRHIQRSRSLKRKLKPVSIYADLANE